MKEIYAHNTSVWAHKIIETLNKIIKVNKKMKIRLNSTYSTDTMTNVHLHMTHIHSLMTMGYQTLSLRWRVSSPTVWGLSV